MISIQHLHDNQNEPMKNVSEKLIGLAREMRSKGVGGSENFARRKEILKYLYL